MKLKEEKGIAGIDIALSVIVIAVFVSIIAVLMFNIQRNEEEIKRKSEATSYAIDIIEEIKGQGFAILPATGTNKITGYEDKYITEDGQEKATPYYQEVTVKDYSELEQNKDKDVEAEVLKIVTVKVSYISGKDNESVEISTVITKED